MICSFSLVRKSLHLPRGVKFCPMAKLKRGNFWDGVVHFIEREVHQGEIFPSPCAECSSPNMRHVFAETYSCMTCFGKMFACTI